MDATMREELRCVVELAQEAGELLLASLGHLGRVDRKTSTELVTDLDRRVEELILGRLEREFPEDAVRAEEGGAVDGASGRTWYVDPLDGTTNYVHGHPFFAVSIGLADAEGLRLGVVHAPYLDELYSGTRGGGARLERPAHGGGRVLQRGEGPRLDEALLATGFPYVRDHLVDRNVEYVRRFLRARCHGVRRAGSAAIDLAHTAAGVLDGFWELQLRPWDVAAGTLVAREAGCLVTSLAGRPAWLTWEEILAAPPRLHAAMRAVLAAPVPDPGEDT